jgi:PAS domain S-box-containing protein
MLDAIDEGIIAADERGVVREINPTAQQLTGYSRDEAVGMALQKVFFIVSATTHTNIQNPLDQVKNKRAAVQCPDSCVLISRDGTECPVSGTASPFFDEQNRVSGVVVAFRDITHERHRSLALLESAYEKAHILYSISSEGIIYYDTDMRILWANVAAASFVDATPEDLIGEYCYHVYGKQERVCPDCPVKRCMESGRYEEEEITTHDNRVWLARGNPVRDDAGRIIGAVENVLDITQRQQANEEIRRSRQQYQTLFEHTGTAAFLVKEDMTIALANSELEVVSGYTKHEVENNMKWTALVAPHDVERMKRYHRQRRQGDTEVPTSYSFDMIGKNGEIRHMLISVDMIPGTMDSIASMVDITERKKTQQRIEHVNRILHAIRAINQAITRETDVDTLIRKVCSILTAYGGSLAAWVVLFDKKNTHIRACAYSGISSEDFSSFCRMIEAETPPVCMADALQQQGLVVTDIRAANDKGCPIINEGKERSLILSQQLHHDETFYGVLGLNVSEEYAQDTEYRTLVEELGEDIAFGLYSIELDASRKRTEEALRESRGRFSAVFNAAENVALILTDADAEYPRIREFNPGAEKIFGYSSVEVMGVPVTALHTADDVARFHEVFSTMRRGKKGFQGEHTLVRKSGEKFPALLTTYPIFEESDAQVQSLLYVVIDISQQRDMEQRLRQSEKMEAIGQLAGGIAHDFNNQLGGIMGFADLLKLRVHEDAKALHYADKILGGVKSAADLTQKLLAFARKGKYQEMAVDMHQVIDEINVLLQRSIDRRITITMRLNAESTIVRGDASQLQNALLNMGLNARDAMPDGGTLTFSTMTAHLDKDFFREKRYSLPSGEYLAVQIRDTGMGMDPQVRERIFEPFFTTKARGKGTGMGLAAAYGTIKNHHGAIDVDTVKGKGSTFTVYIPLDRAAKKDEGSEKPQTTVHGSGTILLVDDEDIIRTLGEEMLSVLGYTVITCENGKEALTYYREHWQSVDLVILDVVMPVMGGKETFMEMKKIDDNVKVLLASGYSIESDAADILNKGVKGFIQKPFTASALSGKIAEILAPQH